MYKNQKRLAKMEKTGYIILIIVAIAWIVAWIIGMFQNIWIGVIGLVMLIGLGLLFLKALRDRMKSHQDDRYSRDVEK
jgi:Flp pilus assembly protein TadB